MQRATFWTILLLGACQAGSSRARIDLSQVYRSDGVSLLPMTKQPIDQMRYFLFSGLEGAETASPENVTNLASGSLPPGATTRTGLVIPNVDDLSMTLEAAAGTHALALLGGTETAEGLRLSYLGFAPAFDLRPGETTEISLPMYPAGILRVSLDRSPALLGLDECEVQLSRTEPLDEKPWTQRLVVPIRLQSALPNSMSLEPMPGTAEPDPSTEPASLTQLFGIGATGVPAGEYRVTCTAVVPAGLPNAGQRLDLFPARTVRVEQLGEVEVRETVRVSGAPENGPWPDHFVVRARESGVEHLNLSLLGFLPPRLEIEAIRADGTRETGFIGRVEVRFFDTYSDYAGGVSAAPAPVGLSISESSPNTYELEFLAGDQGITSAALRSSKNALSFIQVRVIDPQTGKGDSRASGVRLIHIALGPRCVPTPATNTSISQSSHRVFTWINENELRASTDTAGNPVGIDEDLFVAVLGLDPDLDAHCPLSEIDGAKAQTEAFPGITIRPVVAGVGEPLVFVNPQGAPRWAPLLDIEGVRSANLPLNLLANGQTLFKSAVRASDAYVAAGGNLTLSGRYVAAPALAQGAPEIGSSTARLLQIPRP